MLPFGYVFDITITRTIDPENDDAEALTFDFIVYATIDGSTETNPLTGGTNLGVPIPVVEGGVVCAGDV